METLVVCREFSVVAFEKEVRVFVGRDDTASTKTSPEKNKAQDG